MRGSPKASSRSPSLQNKTGDPAHADGSFARHSAMASLRDAEASLATKRSTSDPFCVMRDIPMSIVPEYYTIASNCRRMLKSKMEPEISPDETPGPAKFWNQDHCKNHHYDHSLITNRLTLDYLGWSLS
jgi:hypothetical protein